MKYYLLLFVVLILLLSCKNEGNISSTGEFNLDTIAAAKLGEKLFFDVNMSVGGEISCASCHHPSKAFTDGKSKSIGVNGNVGDRNSPSLLNLKEHPYFMRDGAIETLPIQALAPIRDTNEMGNIDLKLLIDRLKNEEYEKLASVIFNRTFDMYVITQSLKHFQLSMTSENSDYDKYIKGEREFTKMEKLGMQLFIDRFNCASCHAPPTFSTFEFEKQNEHILTQDKGRFMVTKDSSDLFKFKTPSLRNVALTAPYMHDGSVIDLKTASLHNIEQEVDSLEISALLNFLYTLTDTSYMKKLEVEHKF